MVVVISVIEQLLEERKRTQFRLQCIWLLRSDWSPASDDRIQVAIRLINSLMDVVEPSLPRKCPANSC